MKRPATTVASRDTLPVIVKIRVWKVTHDRPSTRLVLSTVAASTAARSDTFRVIVPSLLETRPVTTVAAKVTLLVIAPSHERPKKVAAAAGGGVSSSFGSNTASQQALVLSSTGNFIL